MAAPNEFLNTSGPHWYEIAFAHDAHSYSTAVSYRPERWFVKAQNPSDAMTKCMRATWANFGSCDVATVKQVDWGLEHPVDAKYKRPA